MKKGKFSIKSDNIEIIPVPGDRKNNSEDESPKDDIWYADWKIMLRDPGDINAVQIGVITFEGKPVLGKLIMNFFIEEGYRNKGYASCALKAVRDHLFWRGDIFEIECVITLENDPAIHALTNAKFIYRGRENNDGVKTETYSITKPKSAWAGLYLFIGVTAGLALGILMANLLIGLVTGVLVGLITGTILDSKNLKTRRDITGRKD